MKSFLHECPSLVSTTSARSVDDSLAPTDGRIYGVRFLILGDIKYGRGCVDHCCNSSIDSTPQYCEWRQMILESLYQKIALLPWRYCSLKELRQRYSNLSSQLAEWYGQIDNHWCPWRVSFLWPIALAQCWICEYQLRKRYAQIVVRWRDSTWWMEIACLLTGPMCIYIVMPFVTFNSHL